MESKMLIQFVDGLLSEQEKKKVEQYLFQNPSFFKVIGGMNRIKRDLKGAMSLTDYFEQASNDLQRLMHKQP